MNHEHDLDRLIDEAARQMAQREPSDALPGAVMARVAEGARPFVRREWLWGGVTTGIVAASLILFVSTHRTAEAPMRAQGSGLRAQGTGLTAQEAGLEETGLRAQNSRLREVRRTALDAGAVDEMGQIDDPIVFENISPEPIEVDRLDVAFTSLDPIEIAPIEIEPISLSND